MPAAGAVPSVGTNTSPFLWVAKQAVLLCSSRPTSVVRVVRKLEKLYTEFYHHQSLVCVDDVFHGALVLH